MSSVWAHLFPPPTLSAINNAPHASASTNGAVSSSITADADAPNNACRPANDAMTTHQRHRSRPRGADVRNSHDLGRGRGRGRGHGRGRDGDNSVGDKFGAPIPSRIRAAVAAFGDSAADIAEWKQQRRKHFPTRNRRSASASTSLVSTPPIPAPDAAANSVDAETARAQARLSLGAQASGKRRRRDDGGSDTSRLRRPKLAQDLRRTLSAPRTDQNAQILAAITALTMPQSSTPT